MLLGPVGVRTGLKLTVSSVRKRAMPDRLLSCLRVVLGATTQVRARGVSDQEAQRASVGFCGRGTVAAGIQKPSHALVKT